MKRLLIHIFLFCFTLAHAQVIVNNNKNTTQTPIKLEKKIEIMTFTDKRDGKSYKYAKIGNQTWMLENLNFDYSGSLCYDNSKVNCQKYGRLYTFKMAKNACPDGWRLPTEKECSILFEFCGGIYVAGKVLKGTSLWHKSEKNGLNTLHFSAYPGGTCTSKNSSKIGGINNKFESLGEAGYFWASNTLITNNFSSSFIVFYNQDFIYQSGSDRDSYLSVRCIKM